MDNPTVTQQPPGTELDRQKAAVQALTEASRIMVSSQQLGHLLSRILEISVKVLDSMGGTLYLWDPGAQHLSVQADYPENSDKVARRPVVPGQGIAGWVFVRRKSVIVESTADDERFSEVDRPPGGTCRSLMAAPLLTQHDCLGLLEIYDKRCGRPFDALDLDILEALAGQAAFAIDNSLLSSGLSKQRERLLTIEREIHKKLARDLHDGPAQWLAGMSMNLEYVQRLLDSKPEEARGELESIRTTLDKTIQQIRHLMFELRPVVLESDGIAAALKHYVDSVNKTGGMNLRLDIETTEFPLAMDAQRSIFDIVREALSNVRRHAHTNEGWISVRRDDDQLVVTVRDNGLGFDLEAVQHDYAQRGSLGMLNMMERAAAINGTLVIDSVPDYGTNIQLTVPLIPND